MSFYYDWYFEGETKEPLLRVTLYTPDEIEDIKRKAEVAIVTEITKRVEEELEKKGYKARVVGAWPEVDIWYKEEYIMPEAIYWGYYMRVKGRVRFETDRPLSESPIPAWLVPLLDVILKWVVIGLAAALAIYFLYEWIKSMTLQTTAVEEYSPEGNLIKRTIITAPSLAGISGLIILLIIIFILVMLWRRRE
jgi:hypothetical protein